LLIYYTYKLLLLSVFFSSVVFRFLCVSY